MQVLPKESEKLIYVVIETLVNFSVAHRKLKHQWAFLFYTGQLQMQCVPPQQDLAVILLIK